MKLIGSSMSPYVRRIRLWQAPEVFEYIELNIYTPEGRAELERYTPVMKIPVLVDGDLSILDSRQIYRYIASKVGSGSLTWQQENDLTMIDAANDSFVTLLLLKRSGIDIDSESLIVNLQRERLVHTMALLADKAEKGAFSKWDYTAICLYALLDWAAFRQLFSLDEYPQLAAFLRINSERLRVKATDPRNFS